MRCGGCGRESPDGYKFCQWCGSTLAAPIDLHDSWLHSARQEVVRSIHERTGTDMMMSFLWIVAVVLADVISVVIAVAISAVGWDYSQSDGLGESGAFWVYGLVVRSLGVASTVIFMAFVYLLVKRQNDHYSREARLRSSVMNLIRAASWSPERVNDIVPETMVLSTVEGRQEKQRNPWFRVLIYMIPIAVSASLWIALWMVGGFSDPEDIAIGPPLAIIAVAVFVMLGMVVLEMYLLYFLTKTMLDHDTRWNLFAYNSGRASMKLGFLSGIAYMQPRLPERSLFGRLGQVPSRTCSRRTRSANLSPRGVHISGFSYG